MLSIPKAVVATVFFASNTYAVGQPQAVRWSEKSYGPDGPWAAVTLEIGSPPQSVDLLPGGAWMTNVLEKGICNGTVDCAAEDAGLYDFLASETAVRHGGTGQIEKLSMHDIVGADHSVTLGQARWTFDNITIWAEDGQAGYTVDIPIRGFDMLVITNAEQSLPDGSKYPLTIGKLALGAPERNQSWSDGPGRPRFNATLLTSAAWEGGRTQSDSYSLHVGSPSLNLPGSLVLGGYHKARVLGKISYQPYAIDSLPIDLLDIGIGVAEGASPFNFTSKSGILAEGDSSFAAGQQVTVDATQPYLYLPSTACAALAAYLPIKFQPKYGIYFWDTSSPQYKKIITSPSYLEFTFRDSVSVSSNITVKVPFALLNLTLSSPLISTPTPYFPCFGGQDPTEKWSLGRAFLQAAFIGVKWEEFGSTVPGNWFLGQAPGPNTPKTIAATGITVEDSEIESSETKWEDTWRGVWTVLEEDGTASNSSAAGTTASSSASQATVSSDSEADTTATDIAAAASSSSEKSSGPPIAAIAGGAGGGAVVLLALVGALIFYRRRKARQAAAEYPPTETSSLPFQRTPGSRAYDDKSPYYHSSEMDGEAVLPEMAGKSYHGRFGQVEGKEWKGNGWAHHGQGLGLGPVPDLGSVRAPAELYAPWTPRPSRH